jgi:hypothetical protein
MMKKWSINSMKHKIAASVYTGLFISLAGSPLAELYADTLFTIPPTKLDVMKGASGKQPLTTLEVEDILGTDNQQDTYMEFHTESGEYDGVFTFELPAEIDPNNISELEIASTFKGADDHHQTWQWQIRDTKTRKWVDIADNSDIEPWQWNSISSRLIKNADRYIGDNRSVEMRYLSKDGETSSYLDYLSLNIMLSSEDPEATNHMGDMQAINDYYDAPRIQDEIDISKKFKDKFNLTENQANKVMGRLQKKLIALNDKSVMDVDIFISGILPGTDINSIGNPLNSSAEVSFEPKTKKITGLKLNGKDATIDDITEQLRMDDETISLRNEFQTTTRRENIQKISDYILEDSDPTQLEMLSDSGAPFITLALSADSIKNILQNADDSVTEMDIHSTMESSASNLDPNSSDLVALKEWKNRFKDYLTGTSVLQAQEQWKTSKNTKGLGVSIYYSDATCQSKNNLSLTVHDGYLAPQQGHYQVVEPANHRYDYIEQPNSNHTKVVTGILSTVSNDASLYCNSTTYIGDDNNIFDTWYTNVLPADDNIKTNKLNIESYSLNRYKDAATETRYFPMDRVFDEHVFTHRKVPIFIAAGNIHVDATNTNVLSPAKAFNVITVGNYYRNDSGSFSINKSSRYTNPTTGTRSYQKPEISGPGTDFLYNNSPGYGLDSGTSYATPFAAGIAANLMSYNGFYKDSSAALVKAAMIAGATDPVYGGYIKTGEGGIDMLTTSRELTNAAWWYDQNPTRPFSENVNGRQCFSAWTVNLKADHEARFVISWLNNPANANISRIPNSYTMEILKDGSPVYFNRPDSPFPEDIANEPNQGYQVINLYNAVGKHTVRVCRTDNHDNQRFDIGFALSQRPKDLTSWSNQ